MSLLATAVDALGARGRAAIEREARSIANRIEKDGLSWSAKQRYLTEGWARIATLCLEYWEPQTIEQPMMMLMNDVSGESPCAKDDEEAAELCFQADLCRMQQESEEDNDTRRQQCIVMLRKALCKAKSTRLALSIRSSLEKLQDYSGGHSSSDTTASLSPRDYLTVVSAEDSSCVGRKSISTRDLDDDDDDDDDCHGSSSCSQGRIVLGPEIPLALTLEKAERLWRCWRWACLKQLRVAEGVPCEGCAIAIYCSTDCRNKDVRRTEKRGRPSSRQSHFCGGSSWSHVLSSDAIMAALLLTRRGDHHDNNNNRDRSTALELLFSLSSPLESIVVRDVATALLCVYALESSPDEYYNNSRSSTSSSSISRSRVSLSDFLRSLACIRANSTSITELIAVQRGQQQHSLHRHIEKNKVGSALYEHVSLINHSCLPNCYLSWQGGRAIVRAVSSLSRGDEVSISYGPTVLTGDVDRRRSDLKASMGFTCGCDVCKAEDSDPEFSKRIALSLEHGYQLKTQAEAAIVAKASRPCDIVSTLQASVEALDQTWALAASQSRQTPGQDDDATCPPPIESLLQQLEIYWYAEENSIENANDRVEEALRRYLGEETVARLTRQS